MTEVEREHVHNVYSQIAPHFSDTRFKPWPRIAQFLKEQPVGSLIADVGCGNGKYLGVNPGVVVIGSDICPELVSIARTRGHEVAIFDCLHLPYRSGVFDAAICIAVVHHLSTEERRLTALKELARVVKPGGRILVYVWAMEQERKKFASQDVMVPWHLQPKYSGQSPSMPKPKRSDPSKAAAKREKKAEKLRKKSEKHVKNDLSDTCCAAIQTREELQNEAEGNVGCMLGGLEELCVEEMEGARERKEQVAEDTRERREMVGTRGRREMVRTEHKQREHHPQVRKVEHRGVEPLHCHALAVIRGSSCSSRDKDSTAAASKSPESAELASLGYKTFQRYYHVFCRNELTKLFLRVEGMNVVEEFYDHENWCVLAEKTLTNNFDSQ